jgi:hypothetical protein
VTTRSAERDEEIQMPFMALALLQLVRRRRRRAQHRFVSADVAAWTNKKRRLKPFHCR